MIKKLSGCVREYKKEAILSPITVSLEVVMEVIIPLLMAQLIDNGIEKGDMNYILKMGGVLVGCCLVSLFFGAAAGTFAAKASAGYARNLRRDLYYRVQGFSFGNIDRFSSSSLITRLTTDVTNVQNSFQMIIRIAVRVPLMLIFALVMSMTVNARISLIFLGIIPVLGLGFYLVISHAYPLFEHVFKTYDKLNNVVQENLGGMRVVKSYVRENHEKSKFDKVSQDIFKTASMAERIGSLNSPLMNLCVYACMVLISWFGARMIVFSGGTELTTGELMSIINYAIQILMSMMMLAMVFLMIVISRASAERIVEVLDEKSDLTSPENPVVEVADGAVDFENVGFRYAARSERMCLENIDLHIKSGQTVGILGGTGSSKSSLVQLIPRLYDATTGTVKVGGRDVREYDLESLRNAVAVVLQKNVLFSGTIKENLRWGNANATDEELVHVCELAQADEFIRSFPDGYDTYIEQGGSNVSGGQKQRLCIARALLKKPKVLILDDSTSAVDTHTDALIREAFRKSIPDTTKFIIAQRVTSVMDADVIVLMESGRIAAVGTHDELLASNEIYKEVYTSQQKGATAE